MKKKTEGLSRLVEQIEETNETNPHSRNILLAFTAILLERKRLVEEESCMSVDVSSIDTARLQGGVPVCRQVSLLHPDEPWKKIASAVIPAIASGFPDLAGELRKIEAAVTDNRIELKEYFAAFPELDDGLVPKWSAKLDVRPEVLHLVLISILRPVLEMKAKEVASTLGDTSWDKGYCPICGAFPDMAVIKDKTFQRRLHCSRCRHEWRFDRVLCPYCGHEGKEEGTPYFFVEGKEQETAFACEECKRYIVTLNRVSDLADYDFDVVSIGLTHLDVIMQEKGYVPTACNEWNDFGSPPSFPS
ncbi:MAG: formate dehydrogenase accessory protein FdhE [Candidatus Altiarchaeota archaeon]|nr:formate dehydrogenase accessory protein FdhE [Candidatus Altiarchaeota archaeon]